MAIEIKSSLLNHRDMVDVKKSLIEISEIDGKDKFRVKALEYINDSSDEENDAFFFDMMEFIRFLNPDDDAIAYTDPYKRIFLNCPGDKVGESIRQWEFVYDHECLHQLWDTFAVADKIQKQGLEYNHDILNIASDCVINDYLAALRHKDIPNFVITPENLKDQFGVTYNRKEDTQYSLYCKLMQSNKEALEKFAKEKEKEWNGKIKPGTVIQQQGGGGFPPPPSGKHSEDYIKGWTQGIQDVLDKKVDPLKYQPIQPKNDYDKGYNDVLDNIKKGIENGVQISTGGGIGGQAPNSDLPKIPWDIPNQEQQGGNGSKGKKSDDNNNSSNGNDKTSDEDIDKMSKDEAAKKAQDAADKAKESASNAKDSADKAQANANAAKEKAEKSGSSEDANAAKAAQDAADKAKEDANKAQAAADAAQDAADKAQDAADKGDEKGTHQGAKDARDEANKAAKAAQDAAAQAGDKKEGEGNGNSSSLDIDKMSGSEAAQKAQDAADNAQASADKAKEAADKAKKEASSSGSGSDAKDKAKKAEQLAKNAQEAANKAKEAAKDAAKAAKEGDTDKAREDAKKAMDAADDAAANASEANGENNNQSSLNNSSNSTSSDKPQQGHDAATDNRITQADLEKIREKATKVIEEYKNRLSGEFGKFIKKCKVSCELKKDGLKLPTQHGNSAWNQKMTKYIKAFVKKKIFQKKRELEYTYKRPNRRQDEIKDGDFILKGKHIKKNALTINVAFYIDRSGSMGNCIDDVWKATYRLCDAIKKQFKAEKVVDDILFKMHAFDTSMHPIAYSKTMYASGGTMNFDEILDYINRNTKDYMINVILTDAGFTVKQEEIKKFMKGIQGMVLFITNSPETTVERLAENELKTQLFYILADSNFTIDKNA